MSRGKFTKEAGRQIYFDGKPLISISRESSDASPFRVDQITALLVKMLNRSATAKRYAGKK